MGKRPAARQGTPLWVTAADLPTNAGHLFFEGLNRVLEEAGFDAFVEGLYPQAEDDLSAPAQRAADHRQRYRITIATVALVGCADPHAATVENFRRVLNEYHAQVRPCVEVSIAMDVGTRSSTAASAARGPDDHSRRHGENRDPDFDE